MFSFAIECGNIVLKRFARMVALFVMHDLSREAGDTRPKKNHPNMLENVCLISVRWRRCSQYNNMNIINLNYPYFIIIKAAIK